MTRIVTILTEGFADWEIGFVAAAARGYYGIDIKHAAPGGRPVRSMGDLKVTPDLAIEWIDLDTTDAIVVCGGCLWQTERAPDLSVLLRAAQQKSILVAGICDGTRSLAAAGLLDNIAHTSNSLQTLLESGYGGRAYYRDVPQAVSTDRVITAAGTAPVSFMAEIFEGLGIADANLDFYLGQLAAEQLVRLAPAFAPPETIEHAG